MRYFLLLIIFVLSAFLLHSCGTESTPLYTLSTSVVGEGTITPSGGEYEEGETVTLTGTPSEHWVFDSWSSDGSGSSTTLSITMDRDMNVVGNFQRRNYPLTILIEGEGRVVESIVSQSKTTDYPSEIVVKLTAYPSDDWGFTKWSGHVESTVEELEVTIESQITITAHFERVRCVQNFDPVDFSKSHEELFYVRYPLNQDGTVNEDVLRSIVSDLSIAEYGMHWIATDYNNDGIMDLVGMDFTWEGTVDREQGYTGYERKTPIKFYKGSCNGGFVEDSLNSGKYLGLVHPRKLLQGDYNRDGFVDFFFVGHGYDKQPFPGEFPKLLLSDGEGGFTEHDFESEVAFFHGGTTGDFNNNGWLDVFLVDAFIGKSAIYLNDNGILRPRRDLVTQNHTGGMFNVLWYDINKNGFLDLLMGGHDWDGDGNYTNTPVILYGNGSDFLGEIDVRLPPSKLPNQGLMTDAKIFDIDGDGNYEIIMARTGDSTENPDNFYASWSIQILNLNPDGSYSDKTSSYIEEYHGSLTPCDHTDTNCESEKWIPWLQIRNESGVVILTNSSTPQSQYGYKEWRLQNGFFYRER